MTPYTQLLCQDLVAVLWYQQSITQHLNASSQNVIVVVIIMDQAGL
jgi:hypothetical protein